MSLFANPFSPAGGANVSPGAGANMQTQRSPTGANVGNQNSGTTPTQNSGNNQFNPDPNNPDPNANNGNGNQTPSNNPQTGNDPMGDFAKLWENPPVDDKNKPATPPKYVPDIDPKALSETVGKMNFTGAMTPEVRSKILAGGEDGLNAMMELLNSVGRQAVATTYQAGQRMMAGAIERAESGFLEKVPGQVRNINTNMALGDNPLVNNPAYKPLVDHVTAQFLDRFPKATPNQVSQAVGSYFDKMVTDVSGKSKNQSTSQTNQDKLRVGDGDADWMDWAASEIGMKK